MKTASAIFTGALLLAALAFSAPASAGTVRGDLAVSAEVVSGCTVTAAPMNFGVVAGLTGRVRTTAAIQLRCAPRINYTVQIDRGLNSQGRQRRMLNPVGIGGFLQYNIYQDAGYSQEWDDRGGGRRVTGNSGTTGRVALTAYGEIPSLAGLAASGTYSDTVVVTIQF
ncbi:MAG: hypothetical protein RLZZ08_1573 [Pseudomonadota bacterium]|jgi:spore coat protein U-like protein